MKILFNWVILSVSALLLAISIATPDILSGNVFLNNFINNEILKLLVFNVVVTFFFIYASNLMLTNIEKELKKDLFSKTRREIKKTCLGLVMAIIMVFFALILKDCLEGINLIQESLANSFCLVMLLISILSMFDIVNLICVISCDDITK